MQYAEASFYSCRNPLCLLLQALLTEMARIRLHGFSEREIRQAQATMLSDVESAYIERDQDNSQVLHGSCFVCIVTLIYDP